MCMWTERERQPVMYPHVQDGATAMHMSCEKGRLDVVKALQAHGASVDAVKWVRVGEKFLHK